MPAATQPGPPSAPTFAARTAHMKRSAVRELLKLTAQPGIISLAGGLPAPELFPIHQIHEAAASVLQHSGKRALQYSETEGLAELRDWLATQFSQSGLPVRPANVLIVSGSQQALDLLGRVLLDPGDQVIVENPTYLALLSAWRPLGVQFLPVPSDAHGLCVDALPDLLKRCLPKLIYCVPNFQNPKGTTLAPERRGQLVELARRHHFAVIEDNPYGELRYCGDTYPHLLELAARDTPNSALAPNAIYVGSFSKILAPGLRVGWVIAPEPVIEKLVLAKQAADLHTGTFSQALVWEFVRRGWLADHLPILRKSYRERRDALLRALVAHFPAHTSWTSPDGGMFLMATLPPEHNASALLPLALERKVAYVPGEEFHLHGGQNTLRLNFSNASPALIQEAIRRLAHLL